jgi:general secretion pathway protein J
MADVLMSPRHPGGPRTAASRSRGEAGVTLIELLVTMTVMSVMLILVGGTLISAMTATGRLQASQAAVDDATLLSARLDRELRSAQCISAPAENASGNILTFLTLANGTQSVVTYRVESGKVIRQADLNPDQVLIQNVGTTLAAFKQVVTPLRTVEVAIPIKSTNGGTFLMQTTVAGRNAWRSC